MTTGTMKGHYFGQPKAVVMVATEDSWEHTIVPRLIAAPAPTWASSTGSMP